MKKVCCFSCTGVLFFELFLVSSSKTVYTVSTLNIHEVIPLDFWQNIGPFVLAVVAVIINGVPQLLYAQARGFALKPAGLAYLVGAFGNLFTGSVTPISSQAETITVASVKKDLRNNVSSIPVSYTHLIGGTEEGNWKCCSLLRTKEEKALGNGHRNSTLDRKSVV